MLNFNLKADIWDYCICSIINGFELELLLIDGCIWIGDDIFVDWLFVFIQWVIQDELILVYVIVGNVFDIEEDIQVLFVEKLFFIYLDVNSIDQVGMMGIELIEVVNVLAVSLLVEDEGGGLLVERCERQFGLEVLVNFYFLVFFKVFVDDYVGDVVGILGGRYKVVIFVFKFILVQGVGSNIVEFFVEVLLKEKFDVVVVFFRMRYNWFIVQYFEIVFKVSQCQVVVQQERVVIIVFVVVFDGNFGIGSCVVFEFSYYMIVLDVFNVIFLVYEYVVFLIVQYGVRGQLVINVGVEVDCQVFSQGIRSREVW